MLSFEVNKKSSNLTLSQIYELIWRGSYPKLIADKKVKGTLFYNSYLTTCIEKDTNINQEHNFLQFMKMIVARTGQLLNYTEVAKDVMRALILLSYGCQF